MYIEAATGLPIATAMAEELHRLDRKVVETRSAGADGTEGRAKAMK
jgi:hypothetical protein